MTIASLHTFATQSAFDSMLLAFIKKQEDSRALPYFDTKGLITIGIGYNIDVPANLSLVMQAMGLSASDQASVTSRLSSATMAQIRAMPAGASKDQALQSYLNGALSGGGAFAMTSQQIDAVFPSFAAPRVTAMQALVPSPSYELIALVSLYYNNPVLVGAGIRSGVAIQDPYEARAEVWYQIRYAHANQLWKRRYVEAAMFGLYGNNVSPADASAQALGIYRVITSHRASVTASGVAIIDYDSVFSSYIPLAQQDLNAIGLNSVLVQDLPATLNPARDAVVNWVNTRVATGEQLTASTWNSAAIYVAPTSPATAPSQLDARVDDWRLAGMQGNIMIGTAKADTIYAGAGNDVLFGDDGDDYLDAESGADKLFGGIGQDTFIVAAESATKRIVDSDGRGTVNVRYTTANGSSNTLNLSGEYRSNGSGGWSNNSGSIVFSGGAGSYRALVTTPNGVTTTIEFGANFDPTTGGGDLGIRLTDAPVLATSKTGGSGIDVMVGSYRDGRPQDPPPATPYPQSPTHFYDRTELVANDELIGGPGNNEIYGYMGDDRLVGGDDNDLLHGGFGNDVIIGGGGADVVLPDEVTGVNPAFQWKDTTQPVPVPVPGAAFSGFSTAVLGAGNVWTTIDLYPDAVNTGINWPYTPQTTDAADDVIDTGAGADLVFAGLGRDTVWLGSDGDTAFGGGGDDVIHGESGDDLIYGDGDLQSSPDGRMISFTDASMHGSDILDGGEGNDTIYGGGGSDTIFGGSGDDVISGDGQQFVDPRFNVPLPLQGNDFVDAGSGNDTVIGFGGSDTLLGGEGDDWLFGDSNDLAVADHGDDFLDGGEGNDYLYGQGGSDFLIGGAGANHLYGGDGDDKIYTSSTGDYVDGGNGRDTVYVSAGAKPKLVSTEVIVPVQAAFALRSASTSLAAASSNSDDLVLDAGLSGDDLVLTLNTTYSATSQTATLTFAGSDTTIQLSAEGAGTSLRNSLNSLTFGDGTVWSATEVRDHLRGIATEGNDQLFALNGESDSLIGLGGNDRFYGGNGNDTFYGGDGDDWMSGQDGNDTLDGGAGNDEMQGGAGDDVFIGGIGTDAMRDDSTTSNDVYRHSLGDGYDIIDDRGGNDRLELGAGIATSDVRVVQEGGLIRIKLSESEGIIVGNTLSSGALDTSRMVETVRFADGNVWDVARLKQELLKSTTGADQLYGFETDDAIDGGGGDDNISGMDGNDLLHGGAGNDSLIGQNGNDSLFGDAGDDYLDGGQGDDILVGGLGNDNLFGGTGSNVYRFSAGDGADTIGVANGGADRIEFAAGVSAAGTNLRQDAGSLVISYGTGDSITVGGLFDGQTGQMNTTALNSISFADGTTWTGAAIEAEVLRQALIVTSGADTRYLSANGDTLDAGDGDDTLYGLGGNDNLTGGNGNDKLYGGIDNDTLQGGAGNDTLEGEDGNDTLRGGDGADILRGGYGGLDTFDGGAGNDTLDDLEGADVVLFGRGDGQDVVASVTYSTFGISSTIEFKPGVLPADVVARRVSDGQYPGLAGLELSIAGTTDKIVAKSYFNSGTYSVVQQVRFSDGTVWDATRIAQGVASNDPKVLVGTGAADNLVGGGGNDTFYGLGGGDTLTGKAGDDTYVVYEDAYGGYGGSATSSSDVIIENAGEGIDLVQSTVNWILGANVENLTLIGGSAINGTGNALNNVLVGNAANNRLDGGAGADTMTGGAGNDTYVVDDAGDVITEAASEGTDTVEASLTWTLGSNLENLTLTGTSAINATGNTLANVLTGNSAANTLNGGTGADTMAGGAGDDIYVVDNSSDVVTEAAAAGIDTVQASLTWTLAANVENLTLTGGSAINGTGNTLDNVLTGNSANNTLTGGAGNDTLDGGAGNDTMVGGTGDDIYLVNASGDVVTEAAGEGTDTVRSSVTLTLGSNVENLTLTGTSAINATGNTLNNVLTGNSAANTLNGGTGSDTMVGGAGDDIYVVDSAGDIVTENAGEGTDTVQSGVTWTLGANVENLILTGTTAINGTGNTLDNVLTGNSANNTLTGGAGNDTIDGGAGNDTMVGGTGNDTYVVNVSTDVVNEAANEGIDTVQSAVTLTLGSNVENLTLTGTSAINGTGNTLDNVLVGNSANNTLTGGAGNDTLNGGAGTDTMVGGAGNDSYVVDVATDVVTEAANEGTDTVQSAVTLTLGSNVENLTLTGTSAINGTGNTLNNVLVGNAGANVLTGAAGDDAYDGAAGNDTFTDSSTSSNDAYRWGIGSGLDSLTDSGGTLDHVDLSAGIARSDLHFTKSGNNLELTVTGQTDKLTINNWYLSSANQIEEFRLNDGSKVLASEVPSLLGAGALAASAGSAQVSTGAGRKFAMPVGRGIAPTIAASRLGPVSLVAETAVSGLMSTDQRVHLLLSAMATFNAGAAAIDRPVITARWEPVLQLATPL